MKLFGTDGIRGVYGEGFFVKKNIFILGCAVAAVLGEKHKHLKILVGRDTRESSSEIESALSSGLVSSGAEVVSLGVVPTPAVAHLVRTKKFSAGAVISASHNPWRDNGIKFFSSEGEKLQDELEEDIEKKWQELSDKRASVSEDIDIAIKKITAKQKQDGLKDSHRADYISHILSTIPVDESRRSSVFKNGLDIVVDCANGSTCEFAAEVFSALGAKFKLINNKPDGKNINDGCGSLHPENCALLVKETSASGGLAFDGDGDRVIFIDEKGEVIDGDKIIAVCACYLKSVNRLLNNSVVATVMSNMGFIEYMKNVGINLSLSAVGDRNVWEEMKRTGAALGGEQSGHIIFKEFATSGDGILTAVQFLYALANRVANQGKPSLSAASSIFKKYPQTILNLPVTSKIPLDEIPEFSVAIRREEENMSGRGRVFVRYSGTEPLLRIMVEGPDEKIIQSAAHRLKEIYLKSVSSR